MKGSRRIQWHTCGAEHASAAAGEIRRSQPIACAGSRGVRANVALDSKPTRGRANGRDARGWWRGAPHRAPEEKRTQRGAKIEIFTDTTLPGPRPNRTSN